MENKPWHALTSEETLQALNTSAAGLLAEEIIDRQEKYGPNELQEKAGKTPLRMLWEQFTQTMVLILLAAAGISEMELFTMAQHPHLILFRGPVITVLHYLFQMPQWVALTLS